MKAVRGFVMPSEDASVQKALRNLIREARKCGAIGMLPGSDESRELYERAAAEVASAATVFTWTERRTTPTRKPRKARNGR